MKADARIAGDVDSLIRKFADAYKARNLKGVMECFVPDPDLVLYGTGADEKRVGAEQVRAQVERDWAQTEGIELSITWKSISAAGSVAWAALDGAFKIRAGGQDMALPMRVSVVVENRGGKWLIVHAHFSTPAAGQEEGKSV